VRQKTVQAERRQFSVSMGTSPTASSIQPYEQRASTGEMRQLKIDSLDQNQLQPIEKIQNLLHLTLLNVK
jgi:hypothetical protein